MQIIFFPPKQEGHNRESNRHLYATIKPKETIQKKKFLIEEDFPTPRKPTSKKDKEFTTDYLRKEVCTFINGYAWHHDTKQSMIYCRKKSEWLPYPKTCIRCPDINTP